MSESKAARILMSVEAGMVPGWPLPEYRRDFHITSEEFHTTCGENETFVLNQRLHDAFAYVSDLAARSASGCAPNWIRLEYVWL